MKYSILLKFLYTFVYTLVVVVMAYYIFYGCNQKTSIVKQDTVYIPTWHHWFNQDGTPDINERFIIHDTVYIDTCFSYSQLEETHRKQNKVVIEKEYSIPNVPVYDSNGNVFYYKTDSTSKNKKFRRKILYGTAGIKK